MAIEQLRQDSENLHAELESKGESNVDTLDHAKINDLKDRISSQDRHTANNIKSQLNKLKTSTEKRINDTDKALQAAITAGQTAKRDKLQEVQTALRGLNTQVQVKLAEAETATAGSGLATIGMGADELTRGYVDRMAGSHWTNNAYRWLGTGASLIGVTWLYNKTLGRMFVSTETKTGTDGSTTTKETPRGGFWGKVGNWLLYGGTLATGGWLAHQFIAPAGSPSTPAGRPAERSDIRLGVENVLAKNRTYEIPLPSGAVAELNGVAAANFMGGAEVSLQDGVLLTDPKAIKLRVVSIGTSKKIVITTPAAMDATKPRRSLKVTSGTSTSTTQFRID